MEGLVAELEGQWQLGRSGIVQSRIGPAEICAGTGSRQVVATVVAGRGQVVAVLVYNVRRSASGQEAAQRLSPGGALETLALQKLCSAVLFGGCPACAFHNYFFTAAATSCSFWLRRAAQAATFVVVVVFHHKYPKQLFIMF